MNRLPKLYALLAGVVATTSVACGCPPSEDEVIVFDPQAESLRSSFERCELDALDCEDLCRAVYKLMNGDGSAEYVYFETCELIEVDQGPAVHFVTSVECVGGRLPPGAELEETKCATTASGAWFAKLAELEEASVYAFAMLSKELKLHGAPEQLISRCLDAAVDEVHHARLISALAERFGATLSNTAMPALPAARPLEDVAIENAREGCVRETFGALVAVYQAQHSRDPIVRSVMTQIAVDESRHAELSADIDAWARTMLSPRAQSKLDEAQREALALLQVSLSQPVAQDLIERAGLPDATTNLALFEKASQSVWS
jgi:hypothetical protein